ncbi:aminopeptidase PepB [Corallincola spongiicola]|uniref:Aminopeptidase PepB n=1 Tax=Corallincola spongiicola TaxID=2520508 RepID=A0ABY1WQW9_9GAMM|nr:aminopeptidase PepB [Corallincola spongiicola]TAA47112.1 aminopeptidase PepB [Corallincola spongiicola]
MTEQIVVELTELPAAERWGNHGLSFESELVKLHLKNDDECPLRQIQKAARQLSALGIRQVQLHGHHWQLAEQWAFAQGFATTQGDYQIQWAPMEASGHEELLARDSAFRWLKEVTHLGPEQCTPTVLAERALTYLQQVAGDAIAYEWLQGEELLEQGWIGLHGVGRASQHPPVMLVVDFNPSGESDEPYEVALVGKGITFDSGGYSLKSSEGMLTMKADMGGAATVTAALALAIQRGLDKRVQLILCCAENLVSGEAYKLGDVLTYRNGVTVEVVNTDAEGRIVLADGLLKAAEINPPLLIDAATLTGAAVAALGREFNALFALDDEAAQKALAASVAEQDPLWRLPLALWHQHSCPSAYADTANSRAVKGGGAGGASNAAGFLSRFVPNQGKGWLHFDLAASFNSSGNALWDTGATAQGVQTIAHLLCEYSADEDAKRDA